MESTGNIGVAISAVLATFVDAVERRDAVAVVGLFADGDDVFMAGSEEGALARGKPAVAALIRRLLSSGPRYSFAWTSWHVSSSGATAWVAAEGREDVDHGHRTESIPYRLTAIFERHGDQWRFVHFHGSEPASTRRSGDHQPTGQ